MKRSGFRKKSYREFRNKFYWACPTTCECWEAIEYHDSEQGRRARAAYKESQLERGYIWFQSKLEAERYCYLRAMELNGQIEDLRLQVEFPLMGVQGKRVCCYIVDFVYRHNGETYAEDTKGKATDVYSIKSALFRQQYPMHIFLEVTSKLQHYEPQMIVKLVG